MICSRCGKKRNKNSFGYRSDVCIYCIERNGPTNSGLGSRICEGCGRFRFNYMFNDGSDLCGYCTLDHEKEERAKKPIARQERKPVRPKKIRCNVCNRERMSKFYDDGSNTCKDCLKGKNRKIRRRSKYSTNEKEERYRSFKRYFLDKLGDKCAVCGYNYKTMVTIDFHHVNPDEKEDTVTAMIREYAAFPSEESWKRIEEEIDKCILLCKNCHAITHSRGGLSERRIRTAAMDDVE